MAFTMTQWRITGRSVLWLLGGAFGVVLSVNGIMIWLALDSWPGLVSATPYQDGLAFNRMIEAGESQKALGWHVSVGAPAGVIEIRITDAASQPLTGASLALVAKRPTNEGDDVSYSMSESSPGRYVATSPLPLPGNWDVILDARHGGTTFHTERRIYVEP